LNMNNSEAMKELKKENMDLNKVIQKYF